MTKAEIIAKFNLFMDDTSELSSSEESDLFYRAYRKVWTDRPWEFAKKEATGSTDGTLYISLPSDFMYLTANDNYTDAQAGESARPIIRVGDNEYKVASWSDRKNYTGRADFAWVDVVNDRIEFAVAPATGLTYTFDHVFSPATLASGGTPAFNSMFHDVIYHGMCVDNFVMQQSEKAKSYAAENQQLYNSYIKDMAYYNSNLIQM